MAMLLKLVVIKLTFKAVVSAGKSGSPQLIATQMGAIPDQLPLLWHVLVVFPSTTNPSSPHEYTAVELNMVDEPGNVTNGFPVLFAGKSG
jgi:hypothetical protein